MNAVSGAFAVIFNGGSGSFVTEHFAIHIFFLTFGSRQKAVGLSSSSLVILDRSSGRGKKRDENECLEKMTKYSSYAHL